MAWGGAAYDAAHHLLLIPANNLAAEVRLVPRADYAKQAEADDKSPPPGHGPGAATAAHTGPLSPPAPP